MLERVECLAGPKYADHFEPLGQQASKRTNE